MGQRRGNERQGHGEETAARTSEGVGDIVSLLGCGCSLSHCTWNEIESVAS